jgi:uncharacterized membrane protein
MVWIILVVGAQITWAVGNYIDRWLLVRYKTNDVNDTSVGTLVLVSGFFTIIIGLFVLVVMYALVQYDIVDSSLLLIGRKERITAMIVGVLEILWLIPYLYALNESDETQAPPLFQTVPVFGIVLGALFFDEIPTVLHIVAGAIIITGSLILNVNLGATRRAGVLQLQGKVILQMLLASFIIALAAFLFKVTAVEENYLGTVFWMSIGSFLTACLIWLVVPQYRRDFNAFVERRDVKGVTINIVNEITDNIAILAFYGAVVLGPSTALVQATMAYQPIIVLIIGIIAVWFGSEFHVERFSSGGLTQRIVGITAIVGGSIMIFV